ncbi:MAG: hypothetical protein KDB01_12190 [Planctomycetaceae bacterium]|nr:hypothetical protein [Planctomycetaceae bacterium]
MKSILEKLTARRSQREVQNVASWAQFVADVTDEKTVDADEILTGLERLRKTPEQLVEACELLTRRRAWAEEVAAGERAEAGYSGLQQQLAESEKALEALIEAHQKKQLPLEQKIHATRSAMATGADARSRLIQTAGKATRAAVLGPIESELEAARKDLEPLSKAVQDRRRWIEVVENRGEQAATSDIENLPAMQAGFKKMLADESEAKRRLDEIQARHNAAFSELLKPEAI